MAMQTATAGPMTAQPPFSLWTGMARQARGRLLLAFLTSFVAGAASTATIVLIDRGLAASPATRPDGLAAFAATALTACAALVVSRTLFAQLGQSGLADLRRAIAERVQAASFPSFEAVGSARIQSLVSEDANQIANVLVALPVLATNAVVVLATLGYLAYLSPGLFLAALAAIAVGAAGYSACYGRVGVELREAGKAQDRLFAHFLALGAGAKELRLNRDKGRRFLDTALGPAIDAVARHRSRGLAVLALAGGWGRLLFLALIGLTLFLPGADERAPAVTTGYVVAFLYLMGPLEAVLNTVPLVNLARVGADRVEATFARLDPEPESAVGRAPNAQVAVTLDDVSHRIHDARTGDGFVLGPVSLTLRPGEITFLVGGNGSGKTTLAKVIAGLYAPETGRLSLTGQEVREARRLAHCGHVSAIFSDFHLFETLLERPEPTLDARARAWLVRLGLDHRVGIRDGAWSTRDLSAGQRRRLALVAACLEDRPVLIFDEWAADQDPEFRTAFYETILPELAASGKTLVVVTHDERWFGRADQLLKLDRGRVVEHRTKRTAPTVEAGA
ncbi:MAG: cyclic peptide export ABC transporter [Methylorubrum populi]